MSWIDCDYNGDSYPVHIAEQEGEELCVSAFMMMIAYRYGRYVSDGWARMMAPKWRTDADIDPDKLQKALNSLSTKWPYCLKKTGFERVTTKDNEAKVHEYLASYHPYSCSERWPAIAIITADTDSLRQYAVLCLGRRDETFLFLDPLVGLVASPAKFHKGVLRYNNRSGTLARLFARIGTMGTEPEDPSIVPDGRVTYFIFSRPYTKTAVFGASAAAPFSWAPPDLLGG